MPNEATERNAHARKNAPKPWIVCRKGAELSRHETESEARSELEGWQADG